MPSIPTVRLIHETAELNALQERWNVLADESEYPNIFTTWEWAATWWKWFGDKKPGWKLFVLVIETENELLGIVPLYKKRKRLCFLGYGATPCAEYLGPIIRRGSIDTVCRAILEFLQTNSTQWDSIFLEDYAMDDPGTVELVRRLKESFPHHAEQGESRYYIPLPESYDDYLKSLSAHNRKRKRERLHQSKNRYAANWHVLPEDKFEFWFQTLVELTTLSRNRHREKNPFHQTDYHGFHHELCERLHPGNQVVLGVLDFEEKPAAIWYVYLFHGKCAAYQQGHDTNLKGSPSDVALQMLLMHLIENRFMEFDFLRGGEWYKTNYTDTERRTESLTAFSRKNMAYLVFYMKRRFFQPIKKGVKTAIMAISSLLKKKT